MSKSDEDINEYVKVYYRLMEACNIYIPTGFAMYILFGDIEGIQDDYDEYNEYKLDELKEAMTYDVFKHKL